MAEADPPDPATVKGRATRDRIIGAAARLALTEGFSSLNIDSVRKAASVSGSQMTHYFADKDALVRAIIIRQTQALLDFHRQPALRGLDTFGDFERWAELTLRLRKRTTLSKALPTFGTLVGELGRYDEQTRELLAEGYRQWSDLLANGLRRMKDRGDLSVDADPEELASVLISAHQGGTILSVAYRKPWPDRDALRFAIGYLRIFATDPAERRPPSS